MSRTLRREKLLFGYLLMTFKVIDFFPNGNPIYGYLYVIKCTLCSISAHFPYMVRKESEKPFHFSVASDREDPFKFRAQI